MERMIADVPKRTVLGIDLGIAPTPRTPQFLGARVDRITQRVQCRSTLIPDDFFPIRIHGSPLVQLAQKALHLIYARNFFGIVLDGLVLKGECGELRQSTLWYTRLAQ